MRSAEELLDHLKILGIHVWREDGNLRYRAPKGVLTETLLDELKAHKEQLLNLIADDEHIARIADRPHYECSHAQRRLWFLAQLEQSSVAYNVPLHQLIEGDLNRAALAAAFARVVARHESLRTTFDLIDDEVCQVVQPSLAVPFEFSDLGADALQQALEIGRIEALVPFDLKRGPLMRLKLLKIGSRRHLLLITLHHIICDGVSVAVLGREVSAFYGAYIRGEADSLPALRIQYRDYAHWQNEQLKGSRFEVHCDYWKRKLGGPHPVLSLPLDFARPPRQAFGGGEISVQLSAGLSKNLADLGRENNTRLFVVLIALVKILLLRYTGQEDIIVGSPFAGHGAAELEGQIGFYLNMLPLRDRVNGSMSFLALLGAVRRTVHEAFDHQAYPFDLLVDDVAAVRDLSRSPLFDIAVILQSQKDEGLALDGLVARSCFEHPGTSKFDLTFCFREMPEGLICSIEYASALFTDARIQRMAAHFLRLAEAVTTAPSRPMAQLPLLPDDEYSRLKDHYNRCLALATEERTILELFEQQARVSPDAFAVTTTGNRGSSWSYRDLDWRVARIAARLLGLGVRAEDRVGVMLERSVDLVAVMLGILKAGAAYVPLDPDFPAGRLELMIGDASPRYIITEGNLASKLSDSAVPVLDIAEFSGADLPGDSIYPITDPAALAYVIYTSGSTGIPKGVGITHRSLSNVLQSMRSQPGFDSEDSLLAVTTVSFDIAALELFLPLISGGRLVIADSNTAADGIAILEAIRHHGITVLQGTPAIWRLLLAAGWDGELSLKAWCGGEQLRGSLANEIQAHTAELWNVYGPTETTIWSAARFVEKKGPAEDSTAIGSPVSETQLYVLDRNFELLPIGVPGQLFIGGAGLARGYYGKPGLTAERFLPDPFSRVPGARMYATGDAARSREDGNFTFLGREDNQVKVRGFRIELGEIQSVLDRHAGVRESIAIAANDILMAYVIPSGIAEPNSGELKSWVASHLPAYMTPQTFVFLESWPLTANGKIDRAALPTAAAHNVDLISANPGNITEEILCGIWADVLGKDKVGVDEGFFDLGGHSLRAMQAVARARSALGVDVSISMLFEAPSVRGFAEAISRLQDRPLPALTPAGRQRKGPLSAAQRQIWFHERQQGRASYNVSAVLRLIGPIDLGAFCGAVEEVCRRHDALRTVFPLQEGQPVQIVTDSPADVTVIELDGSDEESAIGQAVFETSRAFQLERDLPFRVRIWRLHPGLLIIAFTLHHIVADEWSVDVLVRELAQIYGGAHLPEPAVQYLDYTQWEHEFLTAERRERAADYWRRRLSTAPPVLELPTDSHRLDAENETAGVATFLVDAETSGRLNTLARASNVTLLMTIQAVCAVLLGRYASQTSVVIGTPVSNRSLPEFENLIGCFVNTIPLRVDLTGNPSAGELLNRVRQWALEGYEHKEFPFEQIVEMMEPDRRSGTVPVFQTMVAMRSESGGDLRLKDVQIELLKIDKQSAKFDLVFTLSNSVDGIRGELVYRHTLWQPASIERMASHLIQLIKSFAATPDSPVWELPMMEADELRQVMAWNHRTAPRPDSSLDRAFAVQALQYPDRAAVEGHERILTYRQLDEKANQLAQLLRRRGIARGHVVGLFLDDAVDVVVSVLAVVKAGGICLPLDTSAVGLRLTSIIEDSNTPLVLTRESLAPQLPRSIAFFALDTGQREIDLQRPSAAGVDVSPDDLALMVYTSGSTGRPKGIAVSHRAILSLVVGSDYVHIRPGDRIGQAANFAFDAFTFELWGALLNGGCVVPLDRDTKLSPMRLATALREQKIDTLFLTTALFNAIADHDPRAFETLRYLLWGGEACDPRRVRRVMQAGPPQNLIHVYGPTESTTFATFNPVTQVAEEASTIPIGMPIKNTEVYVLDPRANLVPAGVPGELALAGDGLACGYMGRAQSTAEKFVPNPFALEPGSRMYLTGDRVRRLPDGTIEFLGRSDDQVKIRGFRIEPAEVAAALESHPSVRQAHVQVQVNAAGDKSLAAYVSGDLSLRDNTIDLHRFLRQRLPEYMVPAGFVVLENLPLNENGKVDRRRLREIPVAPVKVEYSGPTGVLEEALVSIYEEVLQRQGVGIGQDFYSLGGHSLLATQLLSRVYSVFGIEVPISQFLRQSAVAELAEFLEQNDTQAGRCIKVARAFQRMKNLTAQERKDLLEKVQSKGGR